MRYFMDTEFVDTGRVIELISIGLVSEDDREYYALNWYCDFDLAGDWVQDNVLSRLPFRPIKSPYYEHPGVISPKNGLWRGRDMIRKEIVDFIGDDESPELWGWYSSYDFVAFCQIFGTMMDLPKGFPMYCRDLKQWCDQLGNPKLPEQGKGEHNALEDARWNKQAWETLDHLALVYGH